MKFFLQLNNAYIYIPYNFHLNLMALRDVPHSKSGQKRAKKCDFITKTPERYLSGPKIFSIFFLLKSQSKTA